MPGLSTLGNTLGQNLIQHIKVIWRNVSKGVVLTSTDVPKAASRGYVMGHPANLTWGAEGSQTSWSLLLVEKGHVSLH